MNDTADLSSQSLSAKKTHFAVLAIGATARAMSLTETEVYNRLKRYDLIKKLLFDCYDTLHAESIAGVVWNVQQALMNWQLKEQQS